MNSGLNGKYQSVRFDIDFLMMSPGMIGHLKNCFPISYRLYKLFKMHPELPIQEELNITSRCKKKKGCFNVLKFKQASGNIIRALQHQALRW